MTIADTARTADLADDLADLEPGALERELDALSAAERGRRLGGAADAWTARLAANPAAGRISPRVDGVAAGSVATVITSGRHRFVIDEPSALAGDDLGPSPVDYILAGLVGCQTVVYRLIAAELGLRIDALEFEARGRVDVRGLFGDPEIRSGLQGIQLAVRITGPEPLERYEELRRLVDSRCPVGDTLERGTELVTTLDVTPSADAVDAA